MPEKIEPTIIDSRKIITLPDACGFCPPAEAVIKANGEGNDLIAELYNGDSAHLCPVVAEARRKIDELGKQDSRPLVVIDDRAPELRHLLDDASPAIAISRPADLDNIASKDSLTLLVAPTFPLNEITEILKAIKATGAKIELVDCSCPYLRRRISQVRSAAHGVDRMFILDRVQTPLSERLVNSAKTAAEEVFLISSSDDVDPQIDSESGHLGFAGSLYHSYESIEDIAKAAKEKFAGEKFVVKWKPEITLP